MTWRTSRLSVSACLSILGTVFFVAWPGRGVEGQLVNDCPVDRLPEFEEELDVLSAEDRAFVDEFGVALEGFRGLSLEEFRAEFGPRKNYLRSGESTFARGETNRDGAVDIGDAQPVTDLTGRRGRIGRAALSTDGVYLCFTWEEDLGDIWVMELESGEET